MINDSNDHGTVSQGQAEIVGDTAALSEEGHTPRQEFIREMLAMGRVPVPILLRDPSALQDLNLAHKGLGDDVMSAAAEVQRDRRPNETRIVLDFLIHPQTTPTSFSATKSNLKNKRSMVGHRLSQRLPGANQLELNHM